MILRHLFRPRFVLFALLCAASAAQAAPMQLADASPLPTGFIPLHGGPAIHASPAAGTRAAVSAPSGAGPDAKGYFSLSRSRMALPSHFQILGQRAPAPVAAETKPLPAAAPPAPAEDDAAADDDGEDDAAMKLFHGAEHDMTSVPAFKGVVRGLHVSQAWPLPARAEQHFASPFGMRRDPFTGRPEFHTGIDLAAKAGTPVLASADGVVEESQVGKGFGRVIVLRHRDGVESLYGHLSEQDVTVGQHVHQGQRIGAVGSSGRSTGAHLHFQLEENGHPVNPMLALSAPLETGIRFASR
ncbi:MAG: M23 family metallopeptidase [Alphaproteobacteria bacterium]